ncbi:MAG: L,D-transpeptidase family protein [Taibaiella sp.]|nr:L,D-transpeptidase family protein [Taibaiella sp.]
MVKIYIISLLLPTLLLFSCKESGNASEPGKESPIDQKTIARDRSIDQRNAFNDIFLDSVVVEQFIASEKLNDTMSAAIRGFYNARNFEFAWFSSDGLIEQAFSFRSLYSSENDADAFNKSLEHRFDRLRAEKDKTVDPKDPAVVKTELQITQRFISYALKNYTKTGISEAALGTYIPAKRKDIIALADSVLANNTVNTTFAALNESYRLLKVPLQQYRTIAKNGGWQVITASKGKYSIGSSELAIMLVKKRLQSTGELAGSDTTQLFDAQLERAVKTYQLSHGYKATGIITKDLVNDLNISALARTQQLLINMQRMRWLPTQPEGVLIVVNIPEFEVYVDSGRDIVFQMNVVVGREGHNTTMFSGNLSQVVFSPYWNIPPSIVKKEVIPGLRRDKNYLKKRNMEITGKGGFPSVRQRPGERNALGKVKFLFPNSFNIYMHDTPEKGFFDRSERDLSHGCIRLSDATKMANYLLRNSSDWSPEKIRIAMNSGKEQFVKLKSPVPVIITYYTAWVDKKGGVHFADDIYSHDKEMAKKMFANPQ